MVESIFVILLVLALLVVAYYPWRTPPAEIEPVGEEVMDRIITGIYAIPRYKGPRNGRCPCGSGKKFKHCHGLEY
jgi:hypothetical protein